MLIIKQKVVIVWGEGGPWVCLPEDMKKISEDIVVYKEYDSYSIELDLAPNDPTFDNSGDRIPEFRGQYTYLFDADLHLLNSFKLWPE